MSPCGGGSSPSAAISRSSAWTAGCSSRGFPPPSSTTWCSPLGSQPAEAVGSGTQYYCATSLDGFIAEADDTLEWLTGYEGSYDGPGAEPMKGSYDAFYEDVGAIVSGSVTYEWVLNHVEEWPYPNKPFWVLTTRELAVPQGEGVDVRFAQGSVRELQPEVIDAAGERNVWIVGGGDVAS